MLYPTAQAYNFAVLSLNETACIQLLKQGKARLIGQRPIVYAGGYSRVYMIDLPQGTGALRCWTAEVKDAKERYGITEHYLRGLGLPYFVPFEYVDQCLLVQKSVYPALFMEWVQGETLAEFVAAHFQDARLMRLLADEFSHMVKVLHDQQIAHGDLQDQNILVVERPHDLACPFELRLIDYDSLYVPTMNGYVDTIAGIPSYQHPYRRQQSPSGSTIDYFSELAIYLSLRAYAENPTLYDPKQDARLLFEADDFLNPDQATSFSEVARLSPELQVLGAKLRDFCQQSDPYVLQPLEHVIEGSLAVQKSPHSAKWQTVIRGHSQQRTPLIRTAPMPTLKTSTRQLQLTRVLNLLCLFALSIHALMLGTVSGLATHFILHIELPLAVLLLIVGACITLLLPVIHVAQGRMTPRDTLLLQGVGLVAFVAINGVFRLINLFSPSIAHGLLHSVFGTQFSVTGSESIAFFQFAHIALACLLLAFASYLVSDIYVLRVVILASILPYLLTGIVVVAAFFALSTSQQPISFNLLPVCVAIYASVNILLWLTSRRIQLGAAWI